VAKHSTDVDHLVGRSLGRRRYEVVAQIARGGMATVYRVHDRQLDRVVALKVPRPELARDQAFREQFRREARAAARLAHPNVVAVHDSGEDRGLPWIVMELVEGQTLRALLDARGRLDPETSAELLGEIADALDHAHRHGIAHLDVKPENVLLTSDSVKVADFGLVRAAHGASDHALAGTVQYCAPEVLRGGLVDGRADVYSLGVVAYECLTGRVPFGGGDPDRVAWQVLHGRVPAPSRTAPGLSEAIDAAVWHATDPDPDRRFHRASEVAAAMGAPRRRAFDQAPQSPRTPPQGSSAATTVVGSVLGPVLGPVPGPGGRPGSESSPTVLAGDGARPAWARGGSAPAGYAPAGYSRPAPEPGTTGGAWGTQALRPTTGHMPKQRQPRDGWRRRRRRLVGWALLLAVLAAGGAIAWSTFLAASISVPNLIGADLRQARGTVALKHLKVSISAPAPSRTVPAGRVAEQSPGPGGTVRRFTTIRIVPSSGIMLPDLKGKQVGTAEAALTNLGLRWREQDRPSTDVEPGLVAGTDPKAGVPIGPDQQVQVFVSIGRPRVEMPRVAGERLATALADLHRAGFKTRVLRVFDATVPKDSVVNTNPPGGFRVIWGATVQVYASRGPDLVVVPDVRNLTRERAEAALRASGLRWTYPPFRFGGVIAGQDPQPNSQVPRGTVVRLSVSLF
jgi:beta-lactam-binding protein with PASTA domain/tRNA A-37 threonylcarbamoyl transferase component Bud32